MKYSRQSIIAIALVFCGSGEVSAAAPSMACAVLNPDNFQPYIQTLNQQDNETVVNYIPNASAWSWMKQNVPMFECPDKDMEKTYYFRWWTYRKSIVDTWKVDPMRANRFVVMEFLPKVGWSTKFNAISCAAGAHINEGRWLRDSEYIDDYSRFWYEGAGVAQTYSTHLADAIWNRAKVTGDSNLAVNLLPSLVTTFSAWQAKTSMNYYLNGKYVGMYWMQDGYEGGEHSVGGNGIRPMINSYMYGDAKAIAAVAARAGYTGISQAFQATADTIRQRVQDNLWNSSDQFFETRRFETPGTYVSPAASPCAQGDLTGEREVQGYVPWMFNLPEDGKGYEVAWQQLMDENGFAGKYGPTTAERRSPYFLAVSLESLGVSCALNGYTDAYTTSQTLTALSNLLNNYSQSAVDKETYFNLLKNYTLLHTLQRNDGTTSPWIDENADPDTGAWVTRDYLYAHNDASKDRGKDYNHSTYCDLIISQLVGIQPREDDILEINPLVPEDEWAYFCLDNVAYHEKNLTIFWDQTGTKYGYGAGLHVWADGEEIAWRPTLGPVEVSLTAIPEPATAVLLAVGILGVLVWRAARAARLLV